MNENEINELPLEEKNKEEEPLEPQDEQTEDISETEESLFDPEDELSAIEEELPDLSGCIGNFLENKRYTELRVLGLTPGEAYLATRPVEKRSDNRSHLQRTIPRAAGIPAMQMTRDELITARTLFEDLNDSEIRKLYKKVTK